MDPTFVEFLWVLLLGSLLGLELIGKVPPTLHTPLMSGANAISGITVLAALTAIIKAGDNIVLLLLGSVAGEISVWDVDEKKMALELQSDPAFPRVCDLCASPDGVSLVAACATKQQVLARSLALARALFV